MENKPPYEKAAEESAKAVQKVAGVAEKSLDLVSSVSGFCNRIFGPGFAQLGGAFDDWAAIFRYEQALKLSDKVAMLHKARNLNGRTITIPPRLGIPLLQSATLEDDEKLLDMWAGLIANATDPDRAVEASRSFVGRLNSFEPLDAIVLLEVLRWKQKFPSRTGLNFSLDDSKSRGPWPNLRKISAALNEQEVKVALSLENLDRMRLIYDYMPNVVYQEELENPSGILHADENMGTPVPITNEHAMIDLTHSGLALLKACSAE